MVVGGARATTRPDELCRAVDALAPALVALSHRLHDDPEPSWHEHRSAAALARFLGARGLATRLPAFGLPTAFTARAGDRGPTVVLCCEYDALPGLGHACGHNVVAAAAAGAAAVLAPSAWAGAGSIVALGTPAEERGGGKIELLRRGAFTGAAAVLLVHPGPRDVVAPPFRAAASWDLVFEGRASHAAMAAHAGRNALDAAVLAYGALTAARGASRPGDHLAAVLPEGGHAPNVIPARARVAVLARAADGRALPRLAGVVRRAAAAGACAAGCRVTVRAAGPVLRELRTDARLAALVDAHLRRLGRTPVPPAAGDLAAAGSTDLGEVSHQVPTAHPKLRIGASPQHSPAFARAAAGPSADRAVVDGAKLLALTAADVWRSSLAPGSGGET